MNKVMLVLQTPITAAMRNDTEIYRVLQGKSQGSWFSDKSLLWASLQSTNPMFLLMSTHLCKSFVIVSMFYIGALNGPLKMLTQQIDKSIPTLTSTKVEEPNLTTTHV